MRILYLHQYFRTPAEGGAIRSYYIGEALVARGHEVHMITSWNGPYDKQETLAGMQVHYLAVPYDNSMGFLARSKAFLQYLWKARKVAGYLKQSNLVYASSTPLTIGLLALYLYRKFRIPYIFEVRDLWPEAPIQLGVIKNRTLITWLRQLEKKIYQQAAALVALSPGIEAGIRAVHPHKNILLAPNMADCSFFRPGPKPERLIEALGLQNKFVIAYTGAAGVANQLENLVNAAAACQQAGLPVHFLVAASGGRLLAMQQMAKGLSNLSFMPWGNKEQVQEYLAVSDAVYISFGPQPVLQSCSPNKLFDGLAAGKLCIVTTEGWMKELVEDQASGFYAPPHDPQLFISNLKQYLQAPALLQQAQNNARHAAETLFSREDTTEKIVRLVESVAAATPAGS